MRGPENQSHAHCMYLPLEQIKALQEELAARNGFDGPFLNTRKSPETAELQGRIAQLKADMDKYKNQAIKVVTDLHAQVKDYEETLVAFIPGGLTLNVERKKTIKKADTMKTLADLRDHSTHNAALLVVTNCKPLRLTNHPNSKNQTLQPQHSTTKMQ